MDGAGWKGWGFTSQRPIKRAYEQNAVTVQKWFDESYPTIAKQAREESGEVYWGDASIRSTLMCGVEVSRPGGKPR